MQRHDVASALSQRCVTAGNNRIAYDFRGGNSSRKHAYIILTPLNPTFIYNERKKKRRVNFIPKFHSSLKNFVKYFTIITKRYMYETKVPNFIGL